MRPREHVITVLLMITLLYSTSGHHLPFMPEATQTRSLTEWWHDSTVWGDAGAYLDLAQGIDAGPPYRYRVIPIGIVRLMGLPPEVGFVLLNGLSFVLAGWLMAAYTMRMWRFTFERGLFAAVLTVTTVSLQSTLLLPMVDAASYPAGIGVVWCLHDRRHPWAFALVCSLAVATKEIYIAVVPVYALLILGDAYAASRQRSTGVPDGDGGVPAAARRDV